MDKRNLAFGKINFILLTVGVAVIIAGFLLMSGPGTTEQAFNADIFSATRIKVAPLVAFAGFVSIIAAILYKPRKAKTHHAEG